MDHKLQKTQNEIKKDTVFVICFFSLYPAVIEAAVTNWTYAITLMSSGTCITMQVEWKKKTQLQKEKGESESCYH